MPLQISISILGDEQFERSLLRIERHAGDLRPVWDLIEEDIKEINRQQFFSEGARSSGGWAPLADSTIAYKRSHGYPLDILQRTGALFDAATGFTDPNQEVIKQDDWMVFRVTGDPGEYGRYHQSGTSRMPRRRVVEFTEADKIQFVKDIQRYIMTGEVDWLR